MLFIKDCSCCPAFILNGAWKALPCKAMAHTHKSYCQAACALIRHLPLYISFLEMIRDKKDSGLFNHMEQNVYKATYPIGQCIESCDYYIEYHTNPNIFAHYINIYTGTYHHISHHNSPHPGIAVNITMSHVSLPGNIMMWLHRLVFEQEASWGKEFNKPFRQVRQDGRRKGRKRKGIK